MVPTWEAEEEHKEVMERKIHVELLHLDSLAAFKAMLSYVCIIEESLTVIGPAECDNESEVPGDSVQLSSPIYRHVCGSHLTDGSVFLLPVSRWPVPSQLHGQAEINDDTRAFSLDNNIPAVQVPVGDGRLVRVLEAGGEKRIRTTAGCFIFLKKCKQITAQPIFVASANE